MTPREQQAHAFYAARDKRTMQLGATEAAMEAPIALGIDPDLARSPSGQLALLALVDMLFRVHRNIRLEIPDATTPSGQSLIDRAIATASAIDPFQDPLRDPVDGELVLYLSSRPEMAAADVVGCWSGARGDVHISGVPPIAPPMPVADEDDLLGAASAACLVAAAAFALTHNRGATPAAVNLLTRTCGTAVTSHSARGPIDVGHVEVIGAGAVGHALTYWAKAFGVVGLWSVIDGDFAELHNTNRCMGMTVADAGWPDGAPSCAASSKAITAARNVDARAEAAWYDELPEDRTRPDLVLVLANERAVRDQIAQSGLPVLLHATTSPRWTAELHRHIPDRDDCPACRIPTSTQAVFSCSAGPSDPADEHSDDAALPFLSAMAGLMLCAALLDISRDHDVLDSPSNHWLVYLELPRGSVVQTATHRGTACRHQLHAGARRHIQAQEPRRWDSVDD